MSESHDPNQTADVSSVPADSLDAGLAAGFGRPADGPGSVLTELRSHLGPLQPVLLGEAEGESAHVVKPKSDAMPPPEQTGSRYQFQGEIARGGMGAVLRGRDVDLGRDLAVKVLLEKHADRPEVVRRFLEEAQIGGQLQHPGVVPVYDIGRFGDRPFFTMKLVKGHTLAALLAERNEPAQDRPRFLAIALQVAQAMAYAHAKGVIHRDLKPTNVMVGAFGEVQVMDWGLAKVLAEGGIADEERASGERPEEGTLIRTARSGSAGGGTDTEAGTLLGTPAYMPPEQANGDVALLDRRADVFGLGAVLCEILTGQPPYVGRSKEEVRRQAANGDLGDARARLKGCGADAELVDLTLACLSPEAIDRPPDARAVADALSAYEGGVQERLHQAELAGAAARARAVEEARRRRLTLALAGTVLLALTVGGGAWLWLKAERDARQAQLTRDVHAALNRVTALREQAKSASTGSAALFAQAREQAQRALALVESGPADAALKSQVQQLQGELDEEDKDRRLIAALDEARLVQAETVVGGVGEGRFAFERGVPRFREAFAAYGLPVGAGEPATVAARLRQRPAPLHEAVSAALDEWIELAAEPDLRISEPHLDWLRAVAEAVDSEEPWTRQLRAALAEKDAARRRAVLVKLAKEADVRKLSPQRLVRLAVRLWYARARTTAVRLLRQAQQRYPGDFWINNALGLVLLQARPPQHEEAIRYLTAAVAVRPDSLGAHTSLGAALSYKGRWDEAIACARKALELNPKFSLAHANIGHALRDKGKLDAAIASYRQALALDPEYAGYHDMLGRVLATRGRYDEAIACYRQALVLDPKRAETHGSLGIALAEKGRFHDAIASYRQAIALDPKNTVAHNNLGAALKAKGKDDEAIACYRKTIELDPKDAKAHFNLGNALRDKGLLDEAIACYRQTLTLDPRFFRAHTNLGIALEDQGKVEEALASYRQALAVNPRDAKALNNLGGVLKGKGKVDEAIACYQKALDIDPRDARAPYGLGVIHCDVKRDYDAAIACFRQALANDPKYTRAHTGLGNALFARGRVEEALASYRRALALDPRDPKAHTGVGMALVRKGRVEEGIACFRKAIKLAPKFAAPYISLGANLCDVKHDYDGAIASFRKAIALEPKNAVAHHNLGKALRAKGRLDEAIACCREALTLDPRYAGAHNGLGVALMAKGRPDEALACYRKAIALDPKFAHAHNNLGNVLKAKGQLDEAIACYRRAIAIEPRFAYAHLQLGGALQGQGKLEEAIACYRTALALEPSNAQPHAWLGHALLARGRYAEARDATARALQLLGANHPMQATLGGQLRSCRHFLKLQERLPGLLRGEDRPASAGEALDLVTLCRHRRKYAAAVRFFMAAFAADPRLAGDPQAWHRYNAACYACLATAGQGEDAAGLDAKERLALRRQALTWLRADLAAWSRLLASGQPAARSVVQQRMRHWQQDSDLASLREPARLAKLPAEERAAFTTFWADVAALLKKAQAGAKAPGPPRSASRRG